MFYLLLIYLLVLFIIKMENFITCHIFCKWYSPWQVVHSSADLGEGPGGGGGWGMACAYLSGLFSYITIKWNFYFLNFFFIFHQSKKNFILSYLGLSFIIYTHPYFQGLFNYFFFFSSVLFPTKGSYLASHPWLAKCKMFALKRVSFKFLNYENGNKINAWRC